MAQPRNDQDNTRNIPQPDGEQVEGGRTSTDREQHRDEEQHGGREQNGDTDPDSADADVDRDDMIDE